MRLHSSLWRWPDKVHWIYGLSNGELTTQWGSCPASFTYVVNHDAFSNFLVALFAVLLIYFVLLLFSPFIKFFNFDRVWTSKYQFYKCIYARIYHKIHAYFGLLKLKLGHVDFENSGPPKYPQVSRVPDLSPRSLLRCQDDENFLKLTVAILDF